jgi:hypothetical protein
VNVHLSLPPCRSDITFIYVACGTPAHVIISIRFLIPCINVWKMGLRTFMQMHKPYHSFIRGQLMVMLQVHNIIVPITPFYRPSPSSVLCNLSSCFPFQFFSPHSYCHKNPPCCKRTTVPPGSSFCSSHQTLPTLRSHNNTHMCLPVH